MVKDNTIFIIIGIILIALFATGKIDLRGDTFSIFPTQEITTEFYKVFAPSKLFVGERIPALTIQILEGCDTFNRCPSGGCSGGDILVGADGYRAWDPTMPNLCWTPEVVYTNPNYITANQDKEWFYHDCGPYQFCDDKLLGYDEGACENLQIGTHEVEVLGWAENCYTTGISNSRKLFFREFIEVQCETGVLDESTGECVPLNQVDCFETETKYVDCNLCTCQDGGFVCETEVCETCDGVWENGECAIEPEPVVIEPELSDPVSEEEEVPDSVPEVQSDGGVTIPTSGGTSENGLGDDASDDGSTDTQGEPSVPIGFNTILIIAAIAAIAFIVIKGKK